MTWTTYWLAEVDGRATLSDALSYDHHPHLLFSPGPPASLVSAKAPPHHVVETYKCDSLWVVGFSLISTPPIQALDEKKGTIEIASTEYFYGPASPAHVQRLLAQPLGTVPISRLMSPDSPSFARSRSEHQGVPRFASSHHIRAKPKLSGTPIARMLPLA